MSINFTETEKGIANLLARFGYSNKELATVLNLAEPTIKGHIGNISRKIEEKTGIEHVNRVKIVLYVLGKLEVPHGTDIR